jgi:hypothetical protein
MMEKEREEEPECECEESMTSWRCMLPTIVVIILFAAAILIYFNTPRPEKGQKYENLSVYYLMPPDCEDCDLSMIDGISSDLDVEIRGVRTRIVPRPNLLVVYGNRADMALANSKLNVLSLLCEFTNITRACDLRDELKSIESAVDCLNGYNVSPNSVAFYTGDDCEHCSGMKPWIRQLGKEGYAFYTIAIEDENMTQIADDCLSEILDLKGNIPQFVCASLGKHHMGAFESIEDMREFAENCKNA